MTKTKKSFTLYIGANNETGKLERKKITSTLSNWFDGFTMQEGVGFYRGTPEKMCTVYIFADEERIMSCVEELKEVLKQESIGVQKSQPLKFL